VTLTGAQWYDTPATGMSACRTRLAVGVSGGVIVNSATYVSPTRVDLDLNTVGVALGPKTVTLTNPDGQAAAAAIFTVASVPVITATKTVATNPPGPFVAGASITYTVTLTNTGTFAQGDNAGNEFTDVLPSTLTLVSASASSGTTVATLGTNTVTWDGAIAADGGTVTITIQATIKADTTGQVSNQGTLSYDADANGTNDASRLTDDPGHPGAADPTTFFVAASFYTVSPCRLIDTRSAHAPPLVPGSRSFTLAGLCGLPTDASAVSLNITITAPTAPGNLRLFPTGAPLPLVSTINYSPGQTRANNAVAVLSATGALSVQCDQAGGSVELIVDVNGYFK
jgi:fimbrial isopeptide formation D2 family protein